MKGYEELVVWQKSIELVIEVYASTAHFPKEERYGLTSQMRRASVSIPSNIAEGSKRGTRKDFRNFLINSFGSGAELETQVKIAKRLPFGAEINFQKVDELLDEVMRMLNRMVSNLGP